MWLVLNVNKPEKEIRVNMDQVERMEPGHEQTTKLFFASGRVLRVVEPIGSIWDWMSRDKT